MKRDAVNGVLLVATAVVSVLALMWHPTRLTGAGTDFEKQARLAIWVHAILIALSIAGFYALLGFARRLSAAPDLATAGVVAYGVGVIGVMIAAALSGFVSTSLARSYVAADGTMQPMLHELLHYNGMVNQAFAKMHYVAASAALILWSVAILKSRSFSPALGAVGLLAGLANLVILAAGPVVLGVHAVLLLSGVQMGWMVWVGIELIRNAESVAPAAA
jgi:hypothetical protein